MAAMPANVADDCDRARWRDERRRNRRRNENHADDQQGRDNQRYLYFDTDRQSELLLSSVTATDEGAPEAVPAAEAAGPLPSTTATVLAGDG